MKHDGVFKITRSSAAAVKGDAAAMGMKAFELSRMARLGLPVPPAFVLGTSHCRLSYQDPERYGKKLAVLLDEQLHWLHSVTGLGFGDIRKPLLVSVRSGAPVSMPGMMDTLLNIGLSDSTARGLLRISGNPRLVWDSYRRLVQNFAEVVFSVSSQPFAVASEALLVRERVGRVQDLDYLDLAELTQTNLRLFNGLTGKPFPQNPLEQLGLAVQAVFASWNSPRAIEYRRLYGLSDDLHTAVTIQQMVFGNAGGTSGAGVGFTRDPDSGEKRLFFDFLFNSQGEDIVSGRNICSDAERLFMALPESEQALLGICTALEQEYRDAQEFEFTLQDGILYLLQTRTAKRTPWAALRIAVEQVGEGLVGKGEALARLEGFNLGGIQRQRLSAGDHQQLGQGQSAGVGVASGALALDVETARDFCAAGRPAVLVREEMSTADIAGIALSAGVLTARGNRTSHAAVVARHLGKACVTGCNNLWIDPARRVVGFGDRMLSEGELITLDSNTGRVLAGKAAVEVDYPTQWLAEVEKWRRSPDP
ncbi:MAG: pyruvate, phosphate dikinase [Desulfuromonadales bacterium]|nr:pyruvate, phosphate dikinase [Desulfuromonadales bacterium]